MITYTLGRQSREGFVTKGGHRYQATVLGVEATVTHLGSITSLMPARYHAKKDGTAGWYPTARLLAVSVVGHVELVDESTVLDMMDLIESADPDDNFNNMSPAEVCAYLDKCLGGG